jgi:hypothetical protein
MSERFRGLPQPVPGKMTVYFLGPGYGESIVASLPDGCCMVVDACYQNGANLTQAVVNQLVKAPQIDLLVLTHPDQDHLRGAADLLPQVKRIWPWPLHGSLRTLATIAAGRAGIERFRDLRDTLNALDAAIENDLRVSEGGVGEPTWPNRPGVDYQVVSLGPSSSDWNRASAELTRLVSTEPGSKEWARVEQILDGVRSPGDRPNHLSKCVLLTWGPHRILLGGDVENGDGPRSGWQGILRELEPNDSDPDRTDLLRNLSMVKIAHHGSEGAFWPAAWSLHRETEIVKVGVLAPFNRGGVSRGTNPPSRTVLKALRDHLDSLVLTSPNGRAGERARSAGWTPATAARAAGSAAIAAVVLSEAGEASWTLAGEAAQLR